MLQFHWNGFCKQQNGNCLICYYYRKNESLSNIYVNRSKINQPPMHYLLDKLACIRRHPHPSSSQRKKSAADIASNKNIFTSDLTPSVNPQSHTPLLLTSIIARANIGWNFLTFWIFPRIFRSTLRRQSLPWSGKTWRSTSGSQARWTRRTLSWGRPSSSAGLTRKGTKLTSWSRRQNVREIVPKVYVYIYEIPLMISNVELG